LGGLWREAEIDQLGSADDTVLFCCQVSDGHVDGHSHAHILR
jgi:hypothetical protein